MIETIKLFSQNKRTLGTISNLPVIGRVEFDKIDNSIEIDKSLLGQLLAKDCGIVFLTAEGVELKKKEELKAKEAKKTKPVNQGEASLINILRELKTGRSEEEQNYLEELASKLEDSQDLVVKNKKAEAVSMLKSLDEKELKELLSAYPEKETKKLSTTDKIIAYLSEKMK